MSTKIYLGAKVNSAKNGKGVITQIITKSTGYVGVTYDSVGFKKEMAFNLTDETGEALKSKPRSETSGMSRSEKKHLLDRRALAAFSAAPNQKKIETRIKWINGKVYGDENSLGVQLIHKLLYKIQEVADEKGYQPVSDAINSVIKYYKASDRQAYAISKYADENGVKYE